MRGIAAQSSHAVAVTSMWPFTFLLLNNTGQKCQGEDLVLQFIMHTLEKWEHKFHILINVIPILLIICIFYVV